MNNYATFHDLEGKSVFITGGGAGIGAALTEGFISQKAKVTFVQRSDPTELLDRIEKEHGARPHFIQCDITDVKAMQDAIAAAADRQGPIDVLVSNAAWDERHTTESMSVEDWDSNHAVNLRPYFFAAQAVVPGMREAGGGVIINFSSISYMLGAGQYPAYACANAAITGLTRVLAREHGPDNIRVNAVAPGWVLTERQLKLWAKPELLAAHLAKQCLQTHLQPEDIVGTTLFLASDAARMLTGQVIPVDGGTVTATG